MEGAGQKTLVSEEDLRVFLALFILEHMEINHCMGLVGGIGVQQDGAPFWLEGLPPTFTGSDVLEDYLSEDELAVLDGLLKRWGSHPGSGVAESLGPTSHFARWYRGRRNCKGSSGNLVYDFAASGLEMDEDRLDALWMTLECGSFSRNRPGGR